MKVNQVKKVQRSAFKLNPVAAAIAFALASQFSANLAFANAGFGTNTDIAGNTIAVPTYYAKSPQGIRPAYDLNTKALSTTATVDTGLPLRKFVDPLGGLYNGLETFNPLTPTDLSAGIPVAITEKWVNPLVIDPTTGFPLVTSDDYYEVAIVEYTENMHSDLVDYDANGNVIIDPATGKPKLHGTRLRGYVQIETPAIAKGTGVTDITGLIPSEHIPGVYPDGTLIYKWKKDPVTGQWAQSTEQVFFVHRPHYLGPTILAARGTPVRIKFTNYLPYTDANGNSVGTYRGDANSRTGGEYYLPVDETIAGGGPIRDTDGNQIFAKDSNGLPTTIPIKMGQNRAAIHWHGGDSPWISDGTPHQWFAPAGDISYTLNDGVHPNGMGKGDSAANVPDMPDPGPGSYTLYFPNNLSGRLMMYHDHASGLTKLNAYTGMAAGYVVYDPVELTLAANAIGTTLDKKLNAPGNPLDQAPIGLLDAVGIPLVIQDKTFVPKNIGDPATNPNARAKNADGTATTTPASQDAKWDLNHWGQPGDLYFPHVYETNQDPNSADGTNPVGRWDWGPWFWPVFPAQMSLPTGEYGHVTATPEAFMDTSIVNGQAYPSLTVDPKTYRFRILSIGNDRSLNLGLYQAVDANGLVCDANAPATDNTQPIPAGITKTSTPLVAPTLDARQGAPAACTEVRMVPAVPTPGFPADWPTDGRVGGVPDPATAGPDIVQIGNEAGLLPALAILKSQPVNYETNVRSITVFNILQHDLLLMGGERADVLIDFSKYAGQTLIVYNDAPTPMPGLDPRTDYYTGMGDKTDAGGAYDVLPGYGPNTRTVMQIKVNNGAPAARLDTAKLAAALPAAYAKTQPTPLIPESVYNSPFGTGFVNNYAAIGTGSGALNSGLFTFNVPSYVDPADGLTKTTKSIPVINKAIQELFDPIYGRMNATLAVELPFSTATIATTIPLAYIDTPVERLDALKDGEVQIWKVTHNGVDGHPVHFHMVNVQVINRVGWDGTIKPPEPNEVGWKETLRMNPLEDVYVAVKGVRPVTPFGLPRSTRLLDPSQAADASLDFTQIDPTTGQAPALQSYVANGAAGGLNTDQTVAQYSNKITDFDNEYVWHCHILGHEEQDFMRPFIFHPDVVVPDAPGFVTVSGSTVNWTDPTPFGGLDAQGIPTASTDLPTSANQAFPERRSSPKNEVGFRVQESTDGLIFKDVATVPANVTNWTGAKVGASYQVIAYNAKGDSAPGTSTTSTAPGAPSGTATATVYTSTPGTAPAAAPGPTGLTQTLNADGTVTLSWSAVAGATGYSVTVNGALVACSNVDVLATATCIVPKASLLLNGNNAFGVIAQTLSGDTAAATTSLFNGVAKPPVQFTASQGNQRNGSPGGSITLTWANNPLNVNNVTGLTLIWALQGGGGVATNGTQTFAPTVTGATIINLQRDKDYRFTLVANSKAGNSTAVTVQGLSAP